MPKSTFPLAVVLIATMLSVSACATNEDLQDTRLIGTESMAAVAANEALVELVPKEIASTGKLRIGTDPTYPPNEYKDSTGKIVGFDIELFDAVASTLGLKAEYVASTFDNIIPSVVGGTYQVGVSSFTDNKEREEKVDMVTYFNAGMQWVAAAGSPVDPGNACGLKVSVQTGTVQVDDLEERSSVCIAAGKKSIEVQKFDAQADATSAVVLGKVNAMSTDYPVAIDAVKQSQGKVELAGDSNYNAAPYGYAIGKSAGTLKVAIQKAMQSLIDDGTYGKILARWGISSGAVGTAEINPFSSKL